MLLHIASLIVLWGLALQQGKIFEHLITKWKELLLIIFLLLIALFVRLYLVEEISPGMYGDELTVATQSLELVKEQDWPPFLGIYSHPTPLLYMTAASINAFGHTITAIRLPSIIFGVLTVGAFYFLLRLFFPMMIATAGAVLMIFQYTQVILSRLAYEPIPSLFFQIVSAIFLIQYQRTKENRYLIGTALSLGGGLYTYYNFRTFALIVFVLTIFLILRKNWKKQWKDAVLFGTIFFVAGMPFFSYAVIDPAGFWGRITAISIFSRHYSSSEFINELWGNIYRTAILPFYGTPITQNAPLFSGDPNPGKNPSGVPMFDPLTVVLALVGFVYLFIKRRPFFWSYYYCLFLLF
jgi:4-amino-4-deoxy-L-arabinose transferase-like glycosyltransferase